MTSLKYRLQQLGRRRAGIAGPVGAPVRGVLGPRPLLRSMLAPGQVLSALAGPGGGLPPSKAIQPPPQAPDAGVAPGTASGTFRGRLVLVYGTGPGSGIFVYNGTPGPGNPPVFSVVAPGVTADPFGNSVAAVLLIGTNGGPGLLVDQFGNLTLAGADGSALALSPEANLPFTLTTAFSGTMQTLMSMTTLDGSETQAGVVSGLVLGSGATAKECTLITSPYAATGTGLLLQAVNDNATDQAWATFGTVTTQGATLTFTPTFALGAGVFLEYVGAGQIVVITHSAAGSGTDPIPLGVSVGKGEAWGNGGSTSGQSGGTSAIGGSGSGTYSAEPSLAVTPGGTIAWSIPAMGSGTDTLLTGSAVTIHAPSGQPGTVAGFGAGGAASGNTVSVPGARGGNPSFHNPGGGGGGGGGSGPAGGGGIGAAGSPTAGGLGGNSSNGAPGGRGGNPTGNGVAGQAPGAGGGGGSTNASGAAGGAGRTRFTYVTGVPSIIVSHANAAGTDQFGNAYQAGNHCNWPDGASYTIGQSDPFTSGAVAIPASGFTPVLSRTVGPGSYSFSGIMRLKQGATGSIPGNIGFTVPASSFSTWYAFWSLQGASTTFESTPVLGIGTQLNVLGVQATAGNEVVVWFRGVITLTAGGTFVIGCQADGTHPFTAQPGCILTLRPGAGT